MKTIKLTQGKSVKVSDCDYDYLSQWKWCYSNGYAKRNTRGKFIFMHKVILDHISCNKVDNRRRNLKAATRQENNRNIRSSTGSSSKYKGVSWHKATNKWHAQIKVDGKSKHLGYFINEDNAALAYNKVARKYFGEFAFLNKVTK
jgi:hypothetical protein